jgi:NADH-quinone oxidoreductase subunit N
MTTTLLFANSLDSLQQGAPLLALLAGALAVLLADVTLSRGNKHRALVSIALAAVASALVALFAAGYPGAGGEERLIFGVLSLGGLSLPAHAVILLATLFVLLLSPQWLRGRDVPLGEYYALVLFAAMGMLALAASAELLALFLNLELVSISLYILAGIERRNAASTEAAFKYFLLGSFAAAFMLMGIAFVFGATGTTRFAEIARVLAAGRLLQPAFLAIGLGLIFVGFGFKLTLAPFHMYAPDVYEGAPTPVAALIATASKVAGFAALFRLALLASAAPAHPGSLGAVLCVIAAVSMIVGNAGAVIQPSLKRMLAYSSIAHSAYTLVPIVVLITRPALAADAQRAVGYYLLAYTVMTLVAFGVPATLGRWAEGDVDAWQGLGRRSPWLAAAMALALVSLVGIPPTIGFFGKFQLFQVAVRGGQLGLAILGVLSSVASAYYYLRVIVTMYMREPETGSAGVAFPERFNQLALGAGACGILLLVFLAGM